MTRLHGDNSDFDSLQQNKICPFRKLSRPALGSTLQDIQPVPPDIKPELKRPGRSFSDSPKYSVGRDSSVGIVTGYGLDGPGIESRWEARFSATVHTGPGAQPDSCTVGTGSFLGAKRPGRGADHPPPSIAEVKE